MNRRAFLTILAGIIAAPAALAQEAKTSATVTRGEIDTKNSGDFYKLMCSTAKIFAKVYNDQPEAYSKSDNSACAQMNVLSIGADGVTVTVFKQGLTNPDEKAQLLIGVNGKNNRNVFDYLALVYVATRPGILAEVNSVPEYEQHLGRYPKYFTGVELDAAVAAATKNKLLIEKSLGNLLKSDAYKNIVADMQKDQGKPENIKPVVFTLTPAGFVLKTNGPKVVKAARLTQ